jgi:hypothetical protein
MDAEPRRDRRRLSSFVIGGLVGASAAVAALRRDRRRRHDPVSGLGAFEGAPCHREFLAQQRRPRDAE